MLFSSKSHFSGLIMLNTNAIKVASINFGSESAVLLLKTSLVGGLVSVLSKLLGKSVVWHLSLFSLFFFFFFYLFLTV